MVPSRLSAEQRFKPSQTPVQHASGVIRRLRSFDRVGLGAARDYAVLSRHDAPEKIDNRGRVPLRGTRNAAELAPIPIEQECGRHADRAELAYAPGRGIELYGQIAN